MSYQTRLFISTAVLAAALITVTMPAPAQAQTAPTEAASSAMPAPEAITEVNPALLSKGYRLSRLLGSRVVNDNNEKIGTVDDLIISPAEGTPFFVISVGGFLGLGARRVVVSSGSVNLQGQRILVRGATSEALKNLPIFTYAK